MHFIIEKKVLQTNLNFVSKALSSKSPIPALSGIKFELTEEGLVLIGSSLETSIKAFIPLSINDETVIEHKRNGSMIVSGNFINEIVRKVEEDKITIEVIDGNIVKINTKTSKFKLNGIALEEYPKIAIDKSDEFITFSKKELNDIVTQTVFAISKNESRPILTGVYFNLVGNIININATDSYRLSHKVITHNGDVNASLIIPGKTMADLNSICFGEGDVTFHIFGNKVMFEFDNVVFQTKLLEGTYPNTQKLIPEEFNTEFVVNSKSLISTIERASILSRDKTKNVVKMSLSANGLVVSSNSPEIGRVEENVAIDFNKPGEFDISFSARFLKEAIASLDCKEVVIKLNGDMKPFIIVNPEDNSVIQLVLPVRTY